MEVLNQMSVFLQQGRIKKLEELIRQALEDGVEPKVILEQALIEAMSVIGEKFKRGEVFVPEVLLAARAMAAGVEILKPGLVSAGVEPCGRAVIGTVKGDLHDIGKNLVKMMLEGKGLEVIDLGVDVSAEKFLTAAKENDAQIICCSALLTTTMSEMKNVVELCKTENVRDKYKIMIGGAPVTQLYCDTIGADFYTADAASAAGVAYEILTGANR